MEIRNAGTEQEIGDVLALVSMEKYEGNLIARRLDSKGKVVNLTLRVRTVYGPGHRFTESGSKRMPYACWHAYRDVLTAIFDRWPEAAVKSARATYRGREDFGAKFPGTFGDNENGYGAFASGWTRHVPYGRLCPCEGTTLEELRHVESLPLRQREEAALGLYEPRYGDLINDDDAFFSDATRVRYVAAEADAECDAWTDFVAELKARHEHRRSGAQHR